MAPSSLKPPHSSVQASLGLRASILDIQAWQQLRGLKERQLYVLKLLAQAEGGRQRR